MGDLQERISKTIEILESVKEEDVNGKEDDEVILKMRTAELKFTGLSEFIFSSFRLCVPRATSWLGLDKRAGRVRGKAGRRVEREKRATTD